MDLVAVDQGAAERFSPHTPLWIGWRPFQTAFPECSGPHTLGGLVKVKVRQFPSVDTRPTQHVELALAKAGGLALAKLFRNPTTELKFQLP